MPCSKTCGDGFTTRNRSIEQKAVNGGKICEGQENERKNCLDVECPGIDMILAKVIVF